MADCDVVEVVSRREQRVASSVADMMSNPHAVEVLAAHMDGQAAEMELRGAQARNNAIRCEARGDLDAVEMWCEVAETSVAHAAQLRRHRVALISRFARRLPAADYSA